MQRKDFVGATIAGTLALAARPAAAAEPDAPIPADGATSSATVPVDRYMLEIMRKNGIPAGTIAVSKEGRLVYARAFGYRDLAGTIPLAAKNRFRIASCSKPVTAVAIMQFVESGKLKLDDRAFDILSDFAPPNGDTEDPRLRTITIRNLLQHTGGFDSTQIDPQFAYLRAAADALGKPRPASPADIVKYMMGKPLAFAPGSKYIYSNLGYNILGRVIEHLSGQAYGAYVKANVFAPAGIARIELGRTKRADQFADEVEYWDDPLSNEMYSVFEDALLPVYYSYGGFAMEAIDAHGGWVANAVDLTRFLNAVGGSTGKQLLSSATVATMLSKPDLPQYATAPHYYAMGWDVGDGILMNHNGALTWGTSSTIGRIPGGLTYAMCFNRLGFNVKDFIVGLMSGSAAAVRQVTAWPSVDLYNEFD